VNRWDFDLAAGVIEDSLSGRGFGTLDRLILRERVATHGSGDAQTRGASRS
jgi:hypothetical protein